jgi:hypothetical protein
VLRNDSVEAKADAHTADTDPSILACQRIDALDPMCTLFSTDMQCVPSPDTPRSAPFKTLPRIDNEEPKAQTSRAEAPLATPTMPRSTEHASEMRATLRRDNDERTWTKSSIEAIFAMRD